MACEPLDLEVECDKALNVCAPTDSRFKRVVIALLCQGGGGGGGVQPALITDCDGNDSLRSSICAPIPTAEATFVRAAVDAASVASSLTSVITNTEQLRFVRVRNTTDAAVDIAFNGSTPDVDAIAAGATELIDLGSNGRDVRTDVYLQYNSAAPTTGTVYINAYY
jgi:hypothetical protein